MRRTMAGKVLFGSSTVTLLYVVVPMSSWRDLMHEAMSMLMHSTSTNVVSAIDIVIVSVVDRLVELAWVALRWCRLFVSCGWLGCADFMQNIVGQIFG